MIATLVVKPEKMLEAAKTGYLLATDVADYLVTKGLSFREAHGITGKLVNYAARLGKELEELTLDEYREFSSVFEEDVLKITLASSIESRNIPGGTSKQQVTRAINEARAMTGKTDV
jgi:argininosuccinate lyase